MTYDMGANEEATRPYRDILQIAAELDPEMWPSDGEVNFRVNSHDGQRRQLGRRSEQSIMGD